MKRSLIVFLTWMMSLSGLEIRVDETLFTFSFRGFEVWLKEYTSAPSSIACRFVSQIPQQGKPQIFDLDCPAYIFEKEFPLFLEYCEEEVQKQGGTPMGLVAVGAMNLEGLRDYLIEKYRDKEIKNKKTCKAIQLISSTDTENIDVCLSYPTDLSPIQNDQDLKKLWVFYLIQTIAEDRFKQAAAEVNGLLVKTTETRYLLPALTTVGHGIEKWNGQETSSRLLTQFLRAIQILKEHGFTEGELASSKSRLQRHLQRFYQTSPDHHTLADYYASHLAAGLPCSDYSDFMSLSLEMIEKIGMADISEMLQVSFLDETRCITMRVPNYACIDQEKIEETLNHYSSDSLVFTPQESTEVVLDEKNDPFFQLPLEETEEQMLRWIVQTVAKANPFKLAFMRGDLENKRRQLMHIHPLRSMATFFTDPYTKKCVGEILDSFIKGDHFVNDFCDRMKQEAEKDNLLIYVPGFCQAVKANPDQIRIYINNQEYEKIIKYLLKLNDD